MFVVLCGDHGGQFLIPGPDVVVHINGSRSLLIKRLICPIQNHNLLFFKIVRHLLTSLKYDQYFLEDGSYVCFKKKGQIIRRSGELVLSM